MKKKLAMILTCAALMTGIAACGGTGGNTAAASKSAAAGTSAGVTESMASGAGAAESAAAGASDTATASGSTEAGSSEHSTDDGSSYGIDLASEAIQTMSEDRADRDTLLKFRDTYFADKFILEDSDPGADLTYGDAAGIIGTDASLYTASGEKRQYIWQVKDDDSARLMLVFSDTDGDGVYTMTGFGGSNLDEA